MREHALAILALLLSAAGCADQGRQTKLAAEAHPRGARLWADKCGSCHVPVEPGTRSRQHIDRALRVHRARVKLSERDWLELAELLAPARAAR